MNKQPLKPTPEKKSILSTSGLIDLQVNGFSGVDFNDEKITAEGMDKALYTMLT
ncbi:hypothetical protein MNBD_ALPHA02-2489, partial [hydrothermal vent metagenome]